MTNKQTIDGVSREHLAAWAERLERAESGFHGSVPFLKELRALLDNPECCKISDADRALLEAGDYTPEELFGVGGKPSCPDCSKPAAQPQGDVERLRAELSKSNAAHEAASQHQGELNTKIFQLERTLAERDALLREMRELATAIPVLLLAVPNPHDVESRDKHIESVNALIERCDTTLSTSAEPKPRGEAVAKPVAKLHAERLTGRDGEYGVTVENSQWFNTCRLTGGVFNLYVEPTHSGDANEMVAKVVLPERKQSFDDFTFKGCMDAGYNKAIDEVAKLNGLKP